MNRKYESIVFTSSRSASYIHEPDAISKTVPASDIGARSRLERRMEGCKRPDVE